MLTYAYGLRITYAMEMFGIKLWIILLNRCAKIFFLKLKDTETKSLGIFYKQVPGLSEPSAIKDLCCFMELNEIQWLEKLNSELIIKSRTFSVYVIF